MMRKMGLLGVGVVATLALAGMTASNASAKTVLRLTESGVPLTVGEPVGLELRLRMEEHYEQHGYELECGFSYEGALASNEKATDEAKALRGTGGCNNPDLIVDSSGGVKEISLSKSGKATVSIDLGLRYYVDGGNVPCATQNYRKHIKGTFDVGGQAIVAGETTPAVETVNDFCVPSKQVEVTAVLFSKVGYEEILGTELVD